MIKALITTAFDAEAATKHQFLLIIGFEFSMLV